MKILVINNNTQHLDDLRQSIAGHQVEIQLYKPGLKFNDADKDLVILSGGGGEGLEIYDEHKPGKLWYEDQMKFILETSKPIIGICMGFEVISRAFGSSVEKLSSGVKGLKAFKTTELGQDMFDRKTIRQFEAHDWSVQITPEHFDVLAQSSSGIEMIKHQNRPIFATQFHPEKAGGTIKLNKLIYLVA